MLTPRIASADSTGLEAISDPAARQTAETIACTSPATRRYLRHALRDIDARRWGTVLTSMQTDTIDLVSDAVYASASTQPAGDPLRHFLGEPAHTCSASEHAAARAALDAPEESFGPSEVDRCLMRPLRERRRDPACSLAAAVRAALDNDTTTAREYVADVVAATAFDTLYTGKSLTDAQADSLFEHLAFELREVIISSEEEESIAADVHRAFGSLDVDAVRSWRCKDDSKVNPPVSDPQAVFCAATSPAFRPQLVKVNGKEVEIDAARATTRSEDRALSDAKPAPNNERDEKMAEAFLCQAGVECVAGKLDPKKAPTAKIEIGDASYNIALSPTAPRIKIDNGTNKASLGAMIDGAWETWRLRMDLGALIRDRLLGDDAPPAAFRDLSSTALRLRRVVRGLREIMRQGDQHAVVLGPLEALPMLLPHFGDGPPPALVSCNDAKTNLDRMRCAASGDLRATIIAAEEGHIRELSARVAAIVAPKDRSSCVAPSAKGLLEAFAANVPETHQHEDAWAGLEQIRGSAHEVAVCTGATRPEPAFRLSLIPSPGIRISWNGAYHNEFGSDGFRVVPSLDWLAARFRVTPQSSKVRVSLMVSIIDIAAPFAELAMRRSDLNYDRQSLLWLDAIRPRLEAGFSMPSVSRNLYLVGGAALRTVAPYIGGGGKPTTSATYLAVGTPGGAAAEAFSNYFELSFGAKYMF